MNHALVLLPALAIAGWTLLILLLIPYRRFMSVNRGEVRVNDFALGETDQVPAYVVQANRNYMNLLELPTVFYAVCITCFVIEEVTSLGLVLAWCYVLLRVAHSIVHVSYNNVIHRLSLFAVSNVVLALFLFTVIVAVLTLAGIVGS
ncbi:MAG: hypothetical protein COB04_12415 [Gammaproteobacteria bacterium]|nr:MAG: hypothetical protein COB04_12415 [Gammaproteobacteria bacterium]